MTIDITALAAIRPGMSASALQAAIGSAWRPIAPHKGGEVDILENTHGFTAKLDADGRVGRVAYDHRFPREAPIDGLHMGMSLATAASSRPDIAIGDDLPMMRGVRFGLAKNAEGAVLFVKFTLETVNEISFDNPDAVYPEKTAPPYPPAAGDPGAPFADPNLKLAVLSSLLDDKVIDLGTPQQLATHVLGRDVDLEDEGYELIPAALDYLGRYPLTSDLLASVRSLELDGGATIYRYAYYFWDGEDDGFTITSLDGLEHCPNLDTLRVISMIDGIDIRRLRPLRKLRHLSLSSSATSGLEALLGFPALETVRALSNSLYAEVTTAGHPTRRLFDALKARGVRVHVHWMSHSGAGQPPAFE